jgi:hypothetical protein
MQGGVASDCFGLKIRSFFYIYTDFMCKFNAVEFELQSCNLKSAVLILGSLCRTLARR